MANIMKNVISTIFKTSGEKETVSSINSAVKATDNLTKAGTRLGQAGAANGRQFAAQAQGLGGLVAAYAGAAATIFALQQAYAALSYAARSEQTIQGTRTLAAVIGESGDKILAKVQEITRGQLTMAEASTQANLALSSGFNATQIERLAAVASKASIALGRDLTDSYTRLVRGSAKLEPELLDELGILARVNPAVERYASLNNKAVSSLTQFERQQAFLLAVLEEGERKFNKINTSTQTAAVSLSQLSSSIIQLATDLGNMLANTLQPISNFFSGSLGNQLLLLGFIATKVFGVLRREIDQFITQGIDKLGAKFDAFSIKYGDIFSGKGKGFQEAVKEIADGSILKTTAPASEGLKSFKSAIKNESALSHGQLKSGVAELDAQIIKEKERIVKLTDQQTKGELGRFKSTENLNKALLESIAAEKALVDLREKSNKALEHSTVLGRAATATFAGVSATIRGLGAALNFALGALNVIFAVLAGAQLAGTIFDFDVLGKIFEFIRGIGEESRNTSKAIAALLQMPVENSAIVKLAENDKIGYKDREKAGLELEERVKAEIEAIQRRLVNSDEFLSLDFEASVQFSTAMLKHEVAQLNKKLDNTNDPALKAKLQIELAPKQDAIKVLEKGDVFFSGIASQINKTAGLPFENIANVQKQFTKNKGRVLLDFFGVETEIGAIEGVTSRLIKGNEQVIASLVAAKDVTDSFFTAYNDGSLNAQKAAQGVVAIESRLADLRKKSATDTSQTKALEAQRDAAKKLQFELQAIEQFGESVRKQFSSESSLVDNLLAAGKLSASGAYAKTKEDEDLNKFINLGLAIDRGNEAKGRLDSAGKNSYAGKARDNALINERANAIKIAFGSTFALRQQVESIAKAEEKRSLELKIQVAEQERQTNLIKNQADLQRLQSKESQRETLASLQLDGMKLEYSLQEGILNLAVARKNAEKDTLEIIREEVSVTDRLVDSLNELAFQQEKRNLTRELLRAESKKTEYDIFGSLVSDQDRRDADLEVAQKKFNLEMRVIDRQEQQIKDETVNKLRDIEFQQKALEADKELTQLKLSKQAEQYSLEKDTIERQFANDQDKRNYELKRIEIEKKNAIITQESMIAQAQAQKDSQLFELDLIDKNLQLLENQAEILSKFTDEFSGVLDSFLKQQAVLYGKDPSTINSTGLGRDNLNDLKNRLGDARGSLAASRSSVDKIFNSREEAAKAQTKGTIDSLNTQKTTIETVNQLSEDYKKKQLDVARTNDEIARKQLETEALKIQSSLDNLVKTKQITQAESDARLAALGIEKDAAAESLRLAKLRYQLESSVIFQFTQDTASIMKKGLGDTINLIAIDFVNGSRNIRQSFKDLLLNIALDIQKAAVNRFITQPITDGLFGAKGLLTGGINSIFGLGTGLPPVANTSTGAMNVTDLSTGTFAGTYASGGHVRYMAAGGANGLRDRVPAMLEPGEFVLRKYAAQKIGPNNLAKMNAFGNGGGSPNVSVNVQNQGTPQSVQGTPNVSFNGEQLVVDIIMRDIQNNGPIRRTLRGNNA